MVTYIIIYTYIRIYIYIYIYLYKDKYLRIKVAEMDGRYNESSVQWLYNTYNTYNTYIHIYKYTYKCIYIL